jgi:hypothetical protein
VTRKTVAGTPYFRRMWKAQVKSSR